MAETIRAVMERLVRNLDYTGPGKLFTELRDPPPGWFEGGDVVIVSLILTWGDKSFTREVTYTAKYVGFAREALLAQARELAVDVMRATTTVRDLRLVEHDAAEAG